MMMERVLVAWLNKRVDKVRKKKTSKEKKNKLFLMKTQSIL